MRHSTLDIHSQFLKGLRLVSDACGNDSLRIGAELKFPLVDREGRAVSREVVKALWSYLGDQGWSLEHDTPTGALVGARKPGERNDTVASFETGYAKTEFSLAHVANLIDLKRSIDELTKLAHDFASRHEAHFLGYGIHPVSPPSSKLLMKKERTSFWDTVFPSNQVIPPEEGDDVHLFTVNAASHVHVGLRSEEAIKAVNVLNGFAGAQIALMANSPVWKGRADGEHRCVAERIWDWWPPAQGRVGVPEAPFAGVLHYVQCVAKLKPVYVKRDGNPVILQGYDSFAEFYASPRAEGEDLEGERVPLEPDPKDIETHNSCYWYNTRISRYYTVENRVCDQQPPDALIGPAALTLGLVSALNEAWEEVQQWDWNTLRKTRDAACRTGLSAASETSRIPALCKRMLEVAETGLRRRGLGEERFLEPLRERVRLSTCPAIQMEDVFRKGGVEALLDVCTI